MTFMMPVMMLIMYSLTILIVWVAAHRIDGGSMQVGSMTAFITYAMMIVMSFLMLTMMSVMLPMFFWPCTRRTVSPPKRSCGTTFRRVLFVRRCVRTRPAITMHCL